MNIYKYPITLPETENRPLEKEIPIGNHRFLGAMLVSGSVFFGVLNHATGVVECL